MATRKGTHYQSAVDKVSNTIHTADFQASCRQIKQEKQIKSEMIENYENSATSSGSTFFHGTGIKTEPGFSHMTHHGNRSSSRFFDQDPYSDEVIFMGITKPPNNSQINFEIFNFTIKTETPEYFETADGVVVINDDGEENADDNNNIDKATKAKNQQRNGNNKAKKSTNKSTTGIPCPVTAAKDSSINERASRKTAPQTTKDALKEQAVSTTASDSDDQFQTTRESAQTQTEPYSFCNSDKTVSLHRNGKLHYLQYLKDPIYGKEYILIYIKTGSSIRLFSKEFEPQHFYTAFHDWATLPAYQPEHWLVNLLKHYKIQVCTDAQRQQNYMNSFSMNCTKLVSYHGCLLWRVRRYQEVWIVMQDFYNCENVHIYSQADTEFRHLEQMFWRNQNYRYQLSDSDVHYRLSAMKRLFFQYQYWQ